MIYRWILAKLPFRSSQSLLYFVNPGFRVVRELGQQVGCSLGGFGDLFCDGFLDGLLNLEDLLEHPVWRRFGEGGGGLAGFRGDGVDVWFLVQTHHSLYDLVVGGLVGWVEVSEEVVVGEEARSLGDVVEPMDDELGCSEEDG